MGASVAFPLTMSLRPRLGGFGVPDGPVRAAGKTGLGGTGSSSYVDGRVKTVSRDFQVAPVFIHVYQSAMLDLVAVSCPLNISQAGKDSPDQEQAIEASADPFSPQPARGHVVI